MILAAVGLVSISPTNAPAVRSADSFPVAHFSAASSRAIIPASACSVGAPASGSQVVQSKDAVMSSSCANLAASRQAAIGAGLGAAGATIAAITSNSSKSPA
jgi:hypothetical protein